MNLKLVWLESEFKASLGYTESKNETKGKERQGKEERGGKRKESWDAGAGSSVVVSVSV